MERLGNKCLLVADHTLKGLPLKTPDSPVEQPAVERGVEVEEKEDGERATEECCITSLSCAALGLKSTLSETVQNATHLRGKFSHIVFVQHSVLNKQYVYTYCVWLLRQMGGFEMGGHNFKVCDMFTWFTPWLANVWGWEHPAWRVTLV